MNAALDESIHFLLKIRIVAKQ
ncbi:uncharacterized protein CELE_W02D3.13 [Caenorhabditis elegans]|uniref:Uncharacterized protein n=1 Tax=Caenorhabditis elegans TaxID=6239 RepID=A0A2K5ATQ2_CAEEL|nr:Uncharacterized protein CELE_W02D3.13 [Caenorhabditis elegans]SPC47138.1 Uncharacterized protein CELE_W02D3.13 [Caenorhabditis elegans]|eukprot:NP_001348686.1 Uncharacterized protein CELE_W02D3.13 [Caenorhabditis elegans]